MSWNLLIVCRNVLLIFGKEFWTKFWTYLFDLKKRQKIDLRVLHCVTVFRGCWENLNKVLNIFNKRALKKENEKLHVMTVFFILMKKFEQSLNILIWQNFWGGEVKIKIWAVYLYVLWLFSFEFWLNKKNYLYIEPIFDFIFWTFILNYFCTIWKKIWTEKTDFQFWVYFLINQQSERSFFTFWLGEIILNRFNRCLFFVQVKLFRFLNCWFLSIYLTDKCTNI